jgi:hypothetical protein
MALMDCLCCHDDIWDKYLSGLFQQDALLMVISAFMSPRVFQMGQKVKIIIKF